MESNDNNIEFQAVSYEEKFKDILRTSAKGYGLGLVVSVILLLIMKEKDSGTIVSLLFGFTILFGSGISIFLCSKAKTQGYMNASAAKIFSGIRMAFFTSLLGASGIFLVWAIFRMLIGIIVMIPVVLYMAVSYFFNLIYLGIMCLLEKKNKIDSNSNVTTLLDKLVPVLSLIVVILFIFLMFNPPAKKKSQYNEPANQTESAIDMTGKKEQALALKAEKEAQKAAQEVEENQPEIVEETTENEVIEKEPLDLSNVPEISEWIFTLGNSEIKQGDNVDDVKSVLASEGISSEPGRFVRWGEFGDVEFECDELKSSDFSHFELVIDEESNTISGLCMTFRELDNPKAPFSILGRTNSEWLGTSKSDVLGYIKACTPNAIVTENEDGVRANLGSKYIYFYFDNNSLVNSMEIQFW